MKIGFKSHPGLVRANNEDFFIIDEDIGLFLVADGVGGHKAGEVASRMGAETIHSILKERIHRQTDNGIGQIIKEAIDSAHDTISYRSSIEKENKGMGTTVVMGLYQKGRLNIAHVGDSRAYIFSARNIKQVTEDHSMVANLVKAGEISKKDARSHRLKHMISQCLGSEQYLGPDIKSLSVNNEDILLLCSDGLTDMVDDKEIRNVLKSKKKDLQGCADKLVELANMKGGRDNITLLLIENDYPDDLNTVKPRSLLKWFVTNKR